MRPDDPSNGPEIGAGIPAATPWAAPGHQSVAGGYPPPFTAAPFPTGYPPPYPGFLPPRSGPKNELGIASLLFGVFAGVLFWFPVVGLMLGITAVATGFGALARIKRREATNKGAAITGLVLGIVTTIVGALILFGIGWLFFSYQDCIDHAEGRGAYAQC